MEVLSDVHQQAISDSGLFGYRIVSAWKDTAIAGSMVALAIVDQMRRGDDSLSVTAVTTRGKQAWTLVGKCARKSAALPAIEEWVLAQLGVTGTGRPPEIHLITDQYRAMDVVPLANGVNRLDLDGDGHPDLVTALWRENHNAHSFRVFQFSTIVSSTVHAGDDYELVPFFDDSARDSTVEEGMGREQDQLRTSMGADCVLQDIVVLRPKGAAPRPVTVILGSRDYGESYADPRPSTFLVFESRSNPDGEPGRPSFYFQHTKTIRGVGWFCDVNQAFRAELGVTADSTGPN